MQLRWGGHLGYLRGPHLGTQRHTCPGSIMCCWSVLLLSCFCVCRLQRRWGRDPVATARPRPRAPRVQLAPCSPRAPRAQLAPCSPRAPHPNRGGARGRGGPCRIQSTPGCSRVRQPGCVVVLIEVHFFFLSRRDIYIFTFTFVRLCVSVMSVSVCICVFVCLWVRLGATGCDWVRVLGDSGVWG
jgi:hypothetical protein